MAISASTVFEVRTTGSDTACSGGFVAGASGTDYSQQNAAQFSGTDLAVDATVNTKVTSPSHNFVAADVGNLIQITAGAGWTTGFYQIVSVASNAATLDRSPAATSTAGGTWAEGGALATINKLTSAMVASNKAFLKAGVGYTTAATIQFNQTVTHSASAPRTKLIGYATTRGDGGKATLTAQAGTGFLLYLAGNGWSVENLTLNGGAVASVIGVLGGGYSRFTNCKFVNFGTSSTVLNGIDGLVSNCEFTSCSGSYIITSGTGLNIFNCWFHDNSCRCCVVSFATVANCVFSNNSGASSDAIQISGPAVSVRNNTIHASGRHGVSITGNSGGNSIVTGNLITNNGGYGLVGYSSTGLDAGPYFDGNAYYSNTSGNRNNIDDTTTNPVNGVAPYTNTLDVILSADPFVAKASDDYRLNNTAGGGAACRGHGVPASWPGNSLTTSAPDMGAAQHADVPFVPTHTPVVADTWAYVG